MWASGAKATDVIYDTRCDEDKMKQMVYEYGAVMTAIYASQDSFKNYDSGVYSGCE